MSNNTSPSNMKTGLPQSFLNNAEDLYNEELDEEDENKESDSAIASYKGRREKLEKALRSSNPWGRSALGIEAEHAAATLASTKHGLYASVPILCKGKSCPYAFQCELIKYDLAPIGERCPIETAEMTKQFFGYSEEFNIDNASQTDRTLISEIISMNILLNRCQALLAKDATPVVDIAIGVSEDGDEIVQPSVSKAWEAFNSISKRRNENLQLMMATRKDNKDATVIAKENVIDIIADDNFEKVASKPDNVIDSFEEKKG